MEVVNERPITLSRIMGISALVVFGDKVREGKPDFDFGRMESVVSEDEEERGEDELCEEEEPWN